MILCWSAGTVPRWENVDYHPPDFDRLLIVSFGFSTVVVVVSRRRRFDSLLNTLSKTRTTLWQLVSAFRSAIKMRIVRMEMNGSSASGRYAIDRYLRNVRAGFDRDTARHTGIYIYIYVWEHTRKRTRVSVYLCMYRFVSIISRGAAEEVNKSARRPASEAGWKTAINLRGCLDFVYAYDCKGLKRRPPRDLKRPAWRTH